MNHKHRAHHVNVLMHGHNPEHNHTSNKSHRASDNARHHMKEHGNHETNHAKPCDVLMRQHHFHGGITNAPQQYSKGGSTRRKSHRYAEGGHVDDHEESREEHKRGGRAKRQHHNFGDLVNKLPRGGGPLSGGPLGAKPAMGVSLEHIMRMDPNSSQNKFRDAIKNNPNAFKSQYYGKPIQQSGMGMEITPFVGPKFRAYKKGGSCYAEGGEAKEYGEKPLTGQLRTGGRAKRRDHHYDGEPVGDNSVRQEQKKGGRSKRQHHYWGQNFIGRLPLVGAVANSIANTAGTLDPHKYGGAEYVAKTKGQKAADIFSTIGNLGASVLASRGGPKGAPAVPKKKGGRVNHGYRQHHAAGGAGKVRKGMMTKSGHMIHSDI